MSAIEERLSHYRSQGFVIIEGLLSSREIAELKAALEPLERGHPMGRNPFEGERSQRIYSLAGKNEAFLNLATHPEVLAVVDELLLPNSLLSNLQSIRLFPGETAQAWHTDDAFYDIGRPRTKPLSVSAIWAIEAFTAENGATELIPTSHLWANEHPDEQPHTERVSAMPAGSVVLFDGALWHRGGSNRSSGTRLAIVPQYCQPWLRTQESQLLIAPPEVARNYSPRAQSLLGYSIHPPFLGYVDGKHPLRLVDPDYRLHKTHDHEIADRVLERPTAQMIEAQAWIKAEG